MLYVHLCLGGCTIYRSTPAWLTSEMTLVGSPLSPGVVSLVVDRPQTTHLKQRIAVHFFIFFISHVVTVYTHFHNVYIHCGLEGKFSSTNLKSQKHRTKLTALAVPADHQTPGSAGRSAGCCTVLWIKMKETLSELEL